MPVWQIILLLAAAIIFLPFLLIIFFGAPYLPTRSRQIELALDLSGLKPGQVIFDLGCGDGRLLEAAALRGLRSVGYELNPYLAFFAWLRIRKYRGLAKVRLASFWRADLSKADGVFVFLVGHYMKRLDRLLVKQNRVIKLISYGFEVPGKTPDKKQEGLIVYSYTPIAKDS